MAVVINGNGTVTGLAVGGLPDGIVDAGTLASGIDKTSISDSGDATAITIDSSENVGIGVTPESGLNAGRTHFQIGGNGALWSKTAQGANSDLWIGNNTKYTTSGDQYISTDEATVYYQTDGQHVFKVAPSGTADAAISWTDAMTIDNDGGVKVSGLVLDKTSQLVTEGGQITHNGCSFMALNATSGGISFAAAQIQNPYWEGQILVLRYTENPPARFTLSSSSGSGGVGAISLSGDWSPDWGDTLTLLATSATWWNELSRSTNTNY